MISINVFPSLRTVVLSLFMIIYLQTVSGQSDLLHAGPMVGYSTMQEVMLWVQTNKEADVHIEYWDMEDSETRFRTDERHTHESSAYTAHLLADEIEPGRVYEYQLYINDELVERPYPLQFQSQTLWQYRSDPPNFDFAIGSCMYINEARYDRPGRPYGRSYDILNSIYKDDPDFMVWLGDNIYLREADWNSMTGIYHRYSHMRAVEELQALLGSVHHYAIWDDHDYGPNDSDRSYWGKELTTEAFKDFWANLNYDVTGAGGITGTFFWGDCQFFLLDNRYHRMPQSGPEAEILGEAQRQWLFDALRFSSASFKFICVGGQFLSNAALYENHAVFANERNEIIQFLDDHNLHGVVFLTGDRHSSEITRMETTDGDVFYDITCSALTSSTYDHTDEPNTHRVEGSMISENNYAILSVSGERKDRKLKVVYKDTAGRVLYEYDVVFPPYRRR